MIWGMNMDINTLYQASRHMLPRLVLGAAIFIVFWLAAVIAKFCITRLADKIAERRYLYHLLGSAVKIAVVCAGLVTTLGTLGINVTALVTSLGLVGFSLGIALKDPLSNMISGFLVLFYQPFRIGDEITVASNTGRVVDMNLRYTIITNDDNHAMIPNATILSSVLVVKNKSG